MTGYSIHGDRRGASFFGELIGSEYVAFEKEFVDNQKPRTTSKLTALCRRRFGAYVEALKEIIRGG